LSLPFIPCVTSFTTFLPASPLSLVQYIKYQAILRIHSQLKIFREASSCRVAAEQLPSSKIYHVGIVFEIRRRVRRRILYYSYIAEFREKIFYIEKSILKMYGVRQCNYQFPKLKFGVCVGIVDDSTAGSLRNSGGDYIRTHRSSNNKTSLHFLVIFSIPLSECLYSFGQRNRAMESQKIVQND
jgi:hypothetical protein